MSAYEFAEYRAYFSIEPYPEVRADIRNAQLCATVANCAPMKKKGAKPIEATEFLKAHDYWGRANYRQQGVETMKKHAMAWTAAMGGTVHKRED